LFCFICEKLEGGIHRYLETYPDGGLFHGKNFVFDSRVAVAPTAAASGTTDLSNPGRGDGSAEVAGAVAVPVVGRCIDCDAAHDVYSGHIVCTVCRMPVLVCPTCVASCNPPGEYHCSRHRWEIVSSLA
jgi:predicted sulfurtransferase